MNETGVSSARAAETALPAAEMISAADRLWVYESQKTGQEFNAFVPVPTDRRAIAARKDESILKTWRGVPIDKGEKRTTVLRNELANVRDFETQRVIASERMFIIVLATMTILLGSICVFFVMNFHF
jgi:hypothetical protein